MKAILQKFLLSVVTITMFLCSGNPTKNNHQSFGIFLNEDGSLLLSDDDVEAYIRTEHKIVLNQQGMKKWNSYIFYDSSKSPPIPLLAGLYQKNFTFKLDNKVIYTGKFSSFLSSFIYSGITIYDVVFACDAQHNWISIGYWTQDDTATDLRNNEELFDFLDSQGKLR
ncbi:MAG TPA: hypothetical protein VHO70_21305 [Chitinispirillaceae bacterium]|nr:hypothetical protein [Chitinispirillaceae bacterium]